MGVEALSGLGEEVWLDLGDNRALDAIAIRGFAKKLEFFVDLFYLAVVLGTFGQGVSSSRTRGGEGKN
jgi:hypothetical protein